MIFYGAGLCDEHHARACSVYLPTLDYLLGRVVPEAAAIMRALDDENQARAEQARAEQARAEQKD